MSSKMRAPTMPAGPCTPRITANCPSGARLTSSSSADAEGASPPRTQAIKHVRVMVIIRCLSKGARSASTPWTSKPLPTSRRNSLHGAHAHNCADSRADTPEHIELRALESISEICVHAIERDPLLLPGVAIARRHRVVLQRLAIDREAVRAAGAD